MHFPTTKGLYEGDQPITCSHLAGDEDQSEKGGKRVKNGGKTKERVEERNADKKRQKQCEWTGGVD